MSHDDELQQLRQRIEHLEKYLSQFESYQQFDKPGKQLAVKKKVNGKPKASRLSEDWLPSESLIAWARKDFPLVDLQLETDKFIDYWLSRADKGAIKLSWERTFRNWIRQASSSYRSKRETHKRSDQFDFNNAVKSSFD